LPGGGGHPWLPGAIKWRPGDPLPTHPIYRPDKPVPPGQSPDSGIWVIAFVPGKGFKWVAVSPGVPEKPTPVPPDPETPTTPPTEPAPK
jgi:hypothetical protein